MLDTTRDPAHLITDMAARARAAAAELALKTNAEKSDALRAAAGALRAATPAIIAANGKDMERGRDKGLSDAMLDRLKLDESRIEGIAASLESIAALPDPVGDVIDTIDRPNGMTLSRVRIPIGVIGIIYESRPNVTADAAALCMKAGNAVILRGGSEAIESNRALHAVLAEALASCGIPADAVQLVPTTDRAAVGAMLEADGLIDMIVPRGGKSLVDRVQKQARVPVLAHLDGINHLYVDKSADPAKAEAIVVNAKMRRTGICGALETLLIDRDYPKTKELLEAVAGADCEVRGGEDVRALLPGATPARDEDWDTEYLAAILSAKIVDGPEAALDHIRQHSSGHTDAIVAEDAEIAETFLNRVDSAIVMWNASTQFADGGEFGLGAEIGIATGRLHARGPVALEGLTTYKWQVRGTGQTRP